MNRVDATILILLAALMVFWAFIGVAVSLT